MFSYTYRSKEAGRRKGFMGHLTRLANDVVNAQEKGENAETIKTLFTGKFAKHC